MLVYDDREAEEIEKPHEDDYDYGYDYGFEEDNEEKSYKYEIYVDYEL